MGEVNSCGRSRSDFFRARGRCGEAGDGVGDGGDDGGDGGDAGRARRRLLHHRRRLCHSHPVQGRGGRESRGEIIIILRQSPRIFRNFLPWLRMKFS